MKRTYPVLEGQEAFTLEGTLQSAHPERQRLGVALIHGITGSPYSLRPLAEQLAARGFFVVVPRLPGHGTDVQDMRETRYADWRAEVERAVSGLRERFERVIIGGLSMGATLALDLASSPGQSFAAVFTINAPVLDREGFVVKLAPYLERVMPIAPAALAGMRQDDIAKPGVSERAYRSIATAAGNSFVRELPRIREQVKSLRCPILVAYSREDHTVPPANSKALLDLVREANPTELVLERSYHVATLDYDLEILAEHITALGDRVCC